MEKIDLNEYLASNEYPGRGIAVAMAPDGRQMFIGYFIMGRSENSRNRVFDPIPERGGIWQDPHRDQRRPDRYHLRPHEPGKELCGCPAHPHL